MATGNSTYVRKKRTPEYQSWIAMRQRCNDVNRPAYARYGGRGIKVCARWNNFAQFLEDMGPRPVGTSLERKDNSDHYHPGNCCWATRKNQQNNTCRNVFVLLGGRRMTVFEAAQELNVPPQTVQVWAAKEGADASIDAWAAKWRPRPKRQRALLIAS